MREDSPPRGCLVLMERGASWPAEATRELEGSSNVVVVTQIEAEHQGRLWKRVAARCEELSSAGVTLTVTVFVCASGRAADRRASRIRNATRLLALLPSSDSARLVLTADGQTQDTTDELLQVAAALVEGPTGTHVAVRVIAPSSSESHAVPRRLERSSGAVGGRARPWVALEEQTME